MLLAYDAPKTVAGTAHLEDALKGLIMDAALRAVPRDWSQERLEVYAQRLWDECLLGKKYTAGWPTVDAVRKASSAVVADMTTAGVLSGPDEVEKPVPLSFPDFWRHSAAIDARHPSQSPYMRRRRAEWERHYGRWPIENARQEDLLDG